MELHEFHFLRPQWLWALPPLALLLWRLARSGGGAGAWRRIVDPHLLPHLLVGGGGPGPQRLLLLLGCGWLLLVLALAGPSWARLPQPVYQARQYRVLVLDISATMNATDVPPSRLAHARFEVLDLLRLGAEGQTALIAYGAEPYVVSPLTGDAGTIALQVPSLASELLPVPGKGAGPAIGKALELLRQAGVRGGEVILITDGLDNPAAAREAARALSAAGHRLSILAVGTRQGAPVPDPGGGFLEDAGGAILIPRLDPAALGDLSRSGGGRYVESRPDDRDLEALLSGSRPRRMEQDESELAQSDQWREEGPWLLLLLLPLAALAFRRGWLSPLLLAFFIVPPEPASALDWTDIWFTPDQRGSRALAADRPALAAALFTDPEWRAAAHYRASDYEATLEALQGRTGVEAEYNRGNALARLGRLEEAIDSYERALEQDPVHADARHNRELLERLLQQQRERERQASDPPQESGGGEPQEQQPSDRQRGSGEGERQVGGEQQHEGEPPADSRQTREAGAPQPEQGESADSKPQRAAARGEPSDEQQQESGGSRAEAEQTQGGQPTDAGGQPQESNGRAEEPGRSDLLDGGEGGPALGRAPAATAEERPIPESDQAVEQWLRRVPDDPAGLLRQRFLLQHLRNSGQLPRR